MKLKSYFLLTAMVCAVFACSNDDVPVLKEKTPIVPDATLALAVQTDGRVKAKAGEAVEADKAIKKLTVLVFNSKETGGAYDENNYGRGELAASFSQTYGTSGVQAAEASGSVKSGKVDIMLIANLDEATISKIIEKKDALGNNNTSSDVAAIQKKLEAETLENGLTMSSKLLQNVIIEPNVANFVGVKTDGKGDYNGGKEVWGEMILLYHTVAAVRLSSIDVKESEEYKSKSFVLKEVFLANVKQESKIASETLLTGEATSAGASVEVVEIVTADKLLDKYYIGSSELNTTEGLYKTGAAKFYNGLSFLAGSNDYKLLVNNSWTEKTQQKPDVIGKDFYVYENTVGESTEAAATNNRMNYTLMVLKGDYTYALTAEKDSTAKDRYYMLVINDERFGILQNANNETDLTRQHIYRNTRYAINVSIQGPGSEKPFDPEEFAHIAVKVVVANWNVIEIDQPVD